MKNEKWGNEKGEMVTEDDLVDRGRFFLVEIWLVLLLAGPNCGNIF